MHDDTFATGLLCCIGSSYKKFFSISSKEKFFSSIIISKLFELETLTNFFCSRMPSEGSPTKMLH